MKGFKKREPLDKEQAELMAMLMDQGRKIREMYKYSEDEKMLPMAMIFTPDGNLEMMALSWADNKEKYRMAAAANAYARKLKAVTLSFVTDSRWVEGQKFADYFGYGSVKEMGPEQFQREYRRHLQAYGGEVKNFPREIWQEAIVVFTNGPHFPLTVQMAPYKEGPNDTIQWIERDALDHDHYKSDLLTDWWA